DPVILDGLPIGVVLRRNGRGGRCGTEWGSGAATGSEQCNQSDQQELMKCKAHGGAPWNVQAEGPARKKDVLRSPRVAVGIDRMAPRYLEIPSYRKRPRPALVPMTVKLSALRHPFLFAIWHHAASPLRMANGHTRRSTRPWTIPMLKAAA